MKGGSDEDVWRRAQAEGVAILTGNVVDFRLLAVDRPEHHGLLLVYRVNDSSKDLRAADIAVRVAAILKRHPDGLRGVTFVVNNYSVG